MTRRAFTLVELLVVVATIALLLGLSLSMLHGSRVTLREAACESNLHQWHGLVWSHYLVRRGPGPGIGLYDPPFLTPAAFPASIVEAVPQPSTQEPIQPWACPLDKVYWSVWGSSYYSGPGARATFQALDWHPELIVFMDANEPVATPGHLFEVTWGGEIKRGR